MTPEEIEADNVPSTWRSWWRCRITPDGVEVWTRHERPVLELPVVEKRAMRGNQDYRSLHLGAGTKWLKPGER